MTPRRFRCFSVALALFVPACIRTMPFETAARPTMTNAEYEMEQLRALGAATGGRAPTALPPQPMPKDRTLRTGAYVVPPGTSSMPARPKAASSHAAVPTPSLPARTGPVQKAGTLYIGPGGTSSRRVGSIMINSDGTAGQLIGNTIIKN